MIDSKDQLDPVESESLGVENGGYIYTPKYGNIFKKLIFLCEPEYKMTSYLELIMTICVHVLCGDN